MASPARRRVTIARALAVLFGAVALATPAASANAQDAAAGTDDVADACFGAAERAQPLLRQKKLREARALLDVCARDACPRVARSDCREWLVEASDAQPSIVIAAHEIRGAGATREVRDVQGVRAIIDDALFVDRVDATPIVIDPGRHRLRLERNGAEPVVQDVDIHEGEKARVIDAYWHLALPAVARPIPPSVWITGAVGVVATGIGTYLEIAGLSQRGSLDSSCKPTATCTQGQVDAARGQVRAGDVTLGGGLLVLLGTAVLYLTRPTANGTIVPMADQQSAWVGVVPGGVIAGARGTL